MRSLSLLIALVFSFALPALTMATDRFFPNRSASSENGRYKITAISEDNKPGEFVPFASNFIYTLTDTHAKQEVWVRRQSANEGSCTRLYVDSDGWVVIYTARHQLRSVDPNGADIGMVAILNDGISEAERKAYVAWTTAGPMWEDYSVWYFLEHEGDRLFVIRPWWGRRIIVDIQTGALVEITDQIADACLEYENCYAMRELRLAVDTQDQWDTDRHTDAIWPILTSAFLAGKLDLKETIPLLRQLETSNYSGSSSTSGFAFGAEFNGEIEPHSYSTFTLRRVVALSLRRLGEEPKQLPIHVFPVRHRNYEDNYDYQPKPLAQPRHTLVDKLELGMTPEQVLDLIGSPDFMVYFPWEYDMDADPPYTLALKWNGRKLSGIERIEPPRWKSDDQEGQWRDREIVQ